MARKVFDDTPISAIADRIRFNLDSTDTYTTAQMPQGVDRACSVNFVRGQAMGYTEGHEAGYAEGYDAGKSEGYLQGQTAEREKLWNKLQQNGRRTGYRYAFYDWYWDDSIFEPLYPFTCSAVSTEMFRYSSITDTKVPITVTHANSQYVFANNAYLRTIRELNVTASTNFLGWFAGCTSLANVTFGEGSVIGQNIDFSACPLTRESIASILAHLGTVTSAKTLTLGAANRAHLTDSEVAEIMQKGWTLA